MSGGEPIGQVELDGNLVFHVAAENGGVNFWVSHDSGFFSGRVRINRIQSEQITELLHLANRLAPDIAAAQALCREEVLSAEAAYERKVANMIGGGR